MKDVMIDLETYSTEKNAIILTIGAVKFDRSFKEDTIEKCETFYKRINIDSCKKVGLVDCKQTMQWWENQEDEVKYEALLNSDREELKNVLKQFTKWFGKSIYIWGHGDDFDCVILEQAYKACNLKVPWKFWNTRDTRTLFDLANFDIKTVNVDKAHHALYDAYKQVLGVKRSIKLLIK
jgi:exodeoxyribonuclease VIII